ncbi:MAG TPA: hypothetical protein PKJ04_04635 [Nitrospira sp.]|jgi:hypothetical protein|nr:hypothetical protein [Nitrospira sp.]MBX3339070.1 hypothetical protein [Nitrospira sp.]MCW5779199.1 hypothetical protein [Nitrospira sp.]HMZ53765.1 hypothetical protein [Nitrospira sp.]HNO33828.1 hypothetical protein [Nitrospira sp.]
MIRGNLFHRRQMTTLATLALTLVAWAGSAESAPTAGAKGHAKAGAVKTTPAIQTAIRYAEALSQGDRVTAGQLDFACQYRFVTALQGKAKQFAPSGDAFYDACWQTLTDAYAPMLKRSDIAMDILWPSAGPLVFFGDDLPRAPASTFVADVVGISPPGSGLHVTALGSRTIPSGSFKLTRAGKVLAAPTTLVQLAIQYQDPLTSPVSYAAGNVKWTNTIKRPRRALKSMTTQWVVFTGLKQHGFPGDTAVFNLPVASQPEAPGMVADKIPFTTEVSRVLPESLSWWGPNDQPGVLTAAAARAAIFPDLRDRVALLNRVLIIDPQQPDALTVLTRHLYSALLFEARSAHQVPTKDPALGIVVDEFYWNIYAQGLRMDLSNGMEMGGLSQPTPADLLYRLIPALQTLATIRPEQLDNRFRLGVAYRWNNDQIPMVETFEALVKDIPDSRRTPKAEALLQLAWSRINKVSWNRILHDPEAPRAYANAEASLAQAELPLDKFLAEYAMAYTMIFLPNYGDKEKMLHHLTEAKRWFDEVPGKSDAVWRYFLHTGLLKAVLDADPLFAPILATAPQS